MSIDIKIIAERIKYLREEAKLSQQSLADLIGVSRATMSYIETGERKITADELVKLSEVFKISINELLNIDNFSPKEQTNNSKNFITKAQEDLSQKYKELILYILNKVGAKPNVGETVLYKILYYADFDYYYEKKGRKKLIGAIFINNAFGPTPKMFIKIADEMIKKNELIRIKSKHFDHDQTKYLPLREADVSVFSGDELKFIDRVLEKYSDKSAKAISEESHKDPPWKNASKGSVLNYEDVFLRDL